MAFQRSYSKVWWGSEQQMSTIPASLAVAGSSLTSGGFYSYFSQHQQQQQQQPHQQQHSQSQPFTGNGYHSLDYNHLKSYSGNLSRIQEVEDEQNISKLSWGKRDSPGSLRSQDSGFSDNDESHSSRSLGGRSSKTASPSAKSDVGSPTASVRTIATPPTVIRRTGKSEFYSPLVSVSRRISFSGSPATSATHSNSNSNNNNNSSHSSNDKYYEEASIEGSTLLAQLDEMQLVSGNVVGSAKKLNFDGGNDDDGGVANGGIEEAASGTSSKHKRRRRVTRRPTRPLTPTKRRTLLAASDHEELQEEEHEENASSASGSLNELDDSGARNAAVPEYNNETVYLGAKPTTPKPYNNETVILGAPDDTSNNNTLTLDDASLLSPLRRGGFTASTSTPNASARKLQKEPQYSSTFYVATPGFENPLLNGHAPALQSWIRDIRNSCEHEYLSTLQTKSIAQEAFKNLTITTNTVAKLIRQLQQRALYLQSDFERIERLLSGTLTASLQEALSSSTQLIANVAEFTHVLERRSVFFTDSRVDRRKYEENLAQIRIIAKDTQYSLERQHYINLESLLDDVQVLKRYILIALRLVFEKMVRVIVLSIEQGRCDLMLRANINMIATLTNIDYEGFASLTDAFVQNEAVRTLLVVCLESKLSSVRAQALRALATICCAPAAISQLGSCGGIEILRDILQVPVSKVSAVELKRGDMERREAVSLLTQITAAWHGPQHRVDGLKVCVEAIVEGLTQLIEGCNCGQTLLLCAAALNNLSRIEITSHYSIMSNEAIFKLINTLEASEEDVSIFLYEQIVAMLHNMSLNKKCHSHLANGSIINFITSAYQTEFYKSYNSRAESDAQRRTIKAILHTLTRLVQDSSLGFELLEQHQQLQLQLQQPGGLRMPAFFKMAMGSGGVGGAADQQHLPLDSSHSRDITLLARQLLFEQKQVEQQRAAGDEYGRNNGDNGSNRGMEERAEATTSGMKFNLTRQESFV